MIDNSDSIINLQKSNSLLDIMIKAEDWIDGLDLYAFKNWINGELVKGPSVSKYWVQFTLMYPYKDMPDPQGAKRILSYGAKVAFRKGYLKKGKKVENPSDYRAGTKKPTMQKKPIWLVDLKIPKKHLKQFNYNNYDYDEDENTKLADVAREEGINKSEPYTENR